MRKPQITTDPDGNNILITPKGRRVNLGPGTLRLEDAKRISSETDLYEDLHDYINTQIKASLDDLLDEVKTKLKIKLNAMHSDIEAIKAAVEA